MRVDRSDPAQSSPKRGVTITDVARLARVSPSTVSRALSNPSRVNAGTREQVLTASSALGYVPRSHDRSPVSGRTSNIAVLIPDITNQFFFEIIRGAQRQLRAAGYTQLLVDTEASAEVERVVLEQMTRSADGVILAASQLDAAELQEVAKREPIVVINRDVPGVAGVILDTPTGFTHALRHLHSLGHHRIAYIAGPENSWTSARRWEALEAEAEQLGVEVLHTGPWMPRVTAAAAAADAALALGVTACVAFNDLQAVGILARLRERGIDVPGGMSVVGCDDVLGAAFVQPSLTTITAPIEEAGRMATSMLLEQVDPRTTLPHRQRQILPTHLTVRGSSGPAPGTP